MRYCHAIMLDSLRFSPYWPYLVGAPIALASIAALIVLWIRRRSMLDLWLMVVMFLYLVEVPLSYYPAPSRFSPAGIRFGSSVSCPAASS